MDKVKAALNIAKRDLRACYGEEGIFAGLHQYKDYWVRDSMFASFGSIAIKDYGIVKKNISLFLNSMNKKSQIPLRVGRRFHKIFLGFFGIKFKRSPLYTFDFNNKNSVDQNSLVIISAYNYYKKTKDKEFILKNLEKLDKAMSWNFYRDINKDLLIEEDGLTNWTDSVKKKGTILYSNVCHCHALFCISELFKEFKLKEKSKMYLHLHNKVKDKINEIFWTGEHYMDWFDNINHYNYFSTDGNFLAIIWDIADKEKARHIEEAAHIFDLNEIPSQCVHPNYGSSLIGWHAKVAGIKDYHNGLSWLWLGCINALAKYKIGMKKEAIAILKKIADIIVKYDQVYEVYEKNGKPVKRLTYRTEYPFAWSSGLFVHAVKKIIK